MSDTFNPGVCEVTRCILYTYDASDKRDISLNFVTGFEIVQSMSETSYSGSLEITDTANVLEGLPIRAEERLDLWIKSFDLGTEIKILGRITKVTNIQPSENSKSVSFTLHFVSDSTFNAFVQKIIEPHTSSISDMAQSVFKNYYAPLKSGDSLDPNDKTKILPFATRRFPIDTQEYERNLFVQPTVGMTKVIIPDLSPMEAMFFLASRGYNPTSPSNTFRFFETIDGYYFVTDEYFIKSARTKDIRSFFYAPSISYESDNAEAQIKRIESLSVVSKGINTQSDVNSGSYRNEVIELDLVRRKFVKHKFDYDKDAKYIDMDGKPRSLESNPHTEQFRKDIFNERNKNQRTFLLFKNYSGPGDIPGSLQLDKHIPEIVSNRVSYTMHLNNTVLAVGLKGRLDLRPGQIIHLDMKALKSVDDDVTVANDSLSGKYIIQTTAHAGVPEGGALQLQTSLRLAKFDWSKGDAAVESQDAAGDT